MVFRLDPQNLCAHDRARCQIERKLCLFVGSLFDFRFSLILGQRRQVSDRDWQLEFASDGLHRLVVTEYKRGSQRLVPLNQFVDGCLQGTDVELAAQAHLLRHVVKGIAGIELIQEPQSLLREAERKMIAVCDLGNGSRAHAA